MDFRATLQMLVIPMSFAVANGCAAGKGSTDPAVALSNYAHALRDGRIDDAYAMLSDEARRDLSRAAFAKLASQMPEEVADLAKSLQRPPTSTTVTAKVTNTKGETLLLVFEKGAWHIDSSAVDLYSQETPRRAAESFLRALERKRYDVLLKFVPDTIRTGLDAARLKEQWEQGPDHPSVARLQVNLKQALLTEKIEETGESAALPYEGGTLLFKREHGVWRIENF